MTACRGTGVDVGRRSRAALVEEGAAEVGAEGSGLGEVPGVEAEPMHCLAGAPVRRSGGITAAQWFGSGIEGAGVALGCRGGSGVARVGLQGVRAPIKAWPSILVCMPGAGVEQRSQASQRRKRITAMAVARSRGSGGESSGWMACARG